MGTEITLTCVALPVVDAGSQHDIAFWATLLDVGNEEIEQAVRFVGSGVFEVSQYLRTRQDSFSERLQ